VYLGRGTGPAEERVAVKVLRSSADAMVLERLARELAAVSQVQPFVTARVIEASTDGAWRYVVSEFIDGPSLQERVSASGPLAEGELLRLAAGTATALTAIHGAGVVHRDFKPANVLLGPDGPRVVDFGIARLTDATATSTSGVVGTPSYMAPEQLAGGQPTSAVDMFAWAATLAYAATGRKAFGADSVPAVMYQIMNGEPDLAGVPPSLLPLLRQCLAKDPPQRPAARDALLAIVDPPARQPPANGPGPQALAGGAAGGPAGTGPARQLPGSTWPEAADGLPAPGPQLLPVMPGPRRRRWPILAASGAAAALIAAGTLLILKSPSPHGTTAGQGQGSTPPAAQATTTSGPLIPAPFAGTWSGTAMQSVIGDSQVQLPNPVTLTLAAGGRTAHEQNQDCVNTLTLTKVTATVLTFNEPDVPGTCVGGTVTLTLNGKGLAYRWTNNVEQNAGNLSKPLPEASALPDCPPRQTSQHASITNDLHTRTGKHPHHHQGEYSAVGVSFALE
jgi:hypothetical protein